MTTIGSVDIVCSVCKAASEQRCVYSTNRFGSPDLDLRPPEMERSTIRLWLMECPSCGFVNGDISEAMPGAAEAIALKDYKDLKVPGDRAGLMTRFLRHSFLRERTGGYRAAADSALCAAWCADDAGREAAAAGMRTRAADLIWKTIETGETAGAEDLNTLKIRLSDILRRAGKWDEAAALCDALLARRQDAVTGGVLRFEKKLCAAKDARCYTVADADSGDARNTA